jgi:pimeloyl-ACP methyl ester carboxylesterase
LYGQDLLPAGVRSRLIDNNNGCTMHVLEAGFEQPGRPCVLLLHGFPELAFSWRKQLMFLAAAGYHVVAPDQRGYGRSSGTDVAFDDDLLPYTLINRVSDTLGLVQALGHEQVAAVVGHDYGSPVAAWCALLRPDVYRSVVLMSAAFPGPPVLPKGDAGTPAPGTLPVSDLPGALAALPRPRKHYRWYYSTREANGDMWHCRQGVHDFLRAYFHMKSGDWAGNEPFPLESWAAAELARMPTYYVMDLARNMAETVAAEMPSQEAEPCGWLTEAELRVFSGEYGRTGFQGGLQGYRIGTDPRFTGELRAFSGRTIDVPAMFVAGSRDWGTYQAPGALERMAGEICTRYRGTHLVEGAGHWVQQERPEQVNALLLDFLRAVAAAG